MVIPDGTIIRAMADAEDDIVLVTEDMLQSL
jgi:hypothetical protein